MMLKWALTESWDAVRCSDLWPVERNETINDSGVVAIGRLSGHLRKDSRALNIVQAWRFCRLFDGHGILSGRHQRPYDSFVSRTAAEIRKFYMDTGRLSRERESAGIHHDSDFVVHMVNSL